MRKRRTQEEFIAKAVAVHGVGRYDYSQTVYTKGLSKVKIICPEHGEFEQTATGHLTGRGCFRCGLSTISLKMTGERMSTTEFITKAQAIHGASTYDYSQTVYRGARKSLNIICPQHGTFEQKARFHTAGHGCAKCAYAQKSKNMSRDVFEFIEKAKLLHGAETYDYSEVAYISSSQKVTIICPKHGQFKIRPEAHLLSTRPAGGCQRCSYERMGNAKQSTLSEFIAKAQAIHGTGLYDYSQVEYKGTHKSVKIQCLQHGIFEQWPQVHLAGSGCQKCALKKAKDGWLSQAAGRACLLYFLRLYNNSESFFKIGITSHTITKRFASRNRLAGYSYEILAQHTSQDAARIYDWEQSILETFAHLRYHPKHSFGGETECFSSCDEILAIFPL